jgi:hypothetical protein
MAKSPSGPNHGDTAATTESTEIFFTTVGTEGTALFLDAKGGFVPSQTPLYYILTSL